MQPAARPAILERLPEESEEAWSRRLVEHWKESRRRHAKLARSDVNEFCAFVGRDSETGAPIRQESVHVRFQRAADTNRRLIVMAHPESGKSTQLGVLRLLWLLGRAPNLRIAVVSKTADNAKKSTRAMRSYIEKSRELAEVFPELVPGESWKEDFFAVRRAVHSRDPSVQALGLDGTIVGSRVDVMVFDDCLDHENTGSEAERKKTLARIRSGFLDRLSIDGVALFLTNAWHPKDAAHLLEKEGWPCLRVPVVDEDGTAAWPEKWPPHRVEQAREDLGPLEFARAHLCKAREEGESPFDEDAVKAARRRGAKLDLVYAVKAHELPPGAAIYTGIDLAVSAKKGSHLTALVTVLLWPKDMSRQVLWCEAGRWSSREIRNRVLDHDARYGPIFIVENNAAQAWIVDIVYNQADLPEEERRLPTIVPFTTGKNKAHPQYGVEGLAVELDAGKWVIPSTGPEKAVREVEEMVGEALYYTRGAHTGDRLMAWWFSREGARRGRFAGQGETDEKRDLAPPSFNTASAGVRIFESDAGININIGLG